MRHAVTGLLASSLVTLATGASAADWVVTPSVEAGVRWDDNYGLESNPALKNSVSGFEARGELEITAATPRSQWSLIPRIVTLYFPSESEDNSTDASVDSRFRRELQRGSWDFRARYSRDQIIRNEISDPIASPDDLGEGSDVDIDRITVRNRRDRLTLRPSLQFEMTERLQLRASADLNDTSYARNLADEQQGYREFGGTIGLGYETSPRSTVIVSVGRATFDPDAVPGGVALDTGNTDTLTGSVRWETQVTERQRYYAQFHAQQVDRDEINGGSQTEYGGGIGTRWSFVRTDLYLDLLRSAEPNSIGEVVAQSEARFRLTRLLSPKVAASFAARYVDIDPLSGGPNATTDSRRSFAVGAEMDWRIRRTVSLVGRYDYSWRRYEDADSASGNSFGIAIAYSGLSRDDR